MAKGAKEIPFGVGFFEAGGAQGKNGDSPKGDTLHGQASHQQSGKKAAKEKAVFSWSIHRYIKYA
jgi:hypothetical protein